MVYTRSIRSTAWTHMTGMAKQVAERENNREWEIHSTSAVYEYYLYSL